VAVSPTIFRASCRGTGRPRGYHQLASAAYLPTAPAIGNIPEDDWRRTFNLGIGMILVVPEKSGPAAIRALKRLQEPYEILGRISKQKRGSSLRVIYG